MSKMMKCDICGKVIPYYKTLYFLNRSTIFGNWHDYDVCEDCVKKLKEMKNEREKSDQHS